MDLLFDECYDEDTYVDNLLTYQIDPEDLTRFMTDQQLTTVQTYFRMGQGVRFKIDMEAGYPGVLEQLVVITGQLPHVTETHVLYDRSTRRWAMAVQQAQDQRRQRALAQQLQAQQQQMQQAPPAPQPGRLARNLAALKRKVSKLVPRRFRP
jgi:hypothetical protein